MIEKTAEIAKKTRFFRKWHKWISIPLALFMLMIGITGFLLGWKKQLNLLPPTQSGKSKISKTWLPLDSLQNIAIDYAKDSLMLPTTIERLDIRPNKGTMKVVFEHHFSELQLDCTTGKILSIKQRQSDFIEKIHDGSIIDFWFKSTQTSFKQVYTTVLSVGLIILALTGVMLWLNPMRIKKLKDKN